MHKKAPPPARRPYAPPTLAILNPDDPSLPPEQAERIRALLRQIAEEEARERQGEAPREAP